MPTYPYICVVCKKTFDIVQKISDEPLTTCPECGGALKRLIKGGIGFFFNERRESQSIQCGSAQTCCGRETRCDTPPCKE